MLRLGKLKKKRVCLLLLILIIIFYGIFRSKNYEIEYFINDVKIVEKYNRKDKIYEFLFQINDNEFYTVLNNNYIHKKKLVKEIEVKENDNTICIIPKSKKLDLYPLCMEDGNLVSYHLINDDAIIDESYKQEIKYEEKTYNNIKMYYLNNRKYYVWNYNGFYVVTDKGVKELKLFNDDVYNIPLTIKVNNNLLIANYDEQYVFNKFYVINSKNDKIKELNLKNEISFDSYFLGISNNKYAYLFDKNNNQEYIVYPRLLKLRTLSKNGKGKILVMDEWESISLTSLNANETKFTHKELTSYELMDDILYKVQGGYKTKISNENVKEIVYYDENEVYYLIDDKLYYYSDKDGEVLVLYNFEWNFNYKNMIYIF